MRWIQRWRRDDVLRRWRSNQVSLADAASELVRLGYAPLAAWALLERT